MRLRELLHVVAEAAQSLPFMAGDRGVLVEHWEDPDALALLRLVGRLPDPETSAEGRLAWERSEHPADVVRLIRPILGIEVRAGSPAGLAGAVEYLAAVVNRELPSCQAESDHRHGALSIQQILRRRLRVLLAVTPPGAPLGTAFVPTETTGLIAAAPHPAPPGQVQVETEDHRTPIPVRSPSL